MSGVDVLRVMRNAAFELRTVTTGNEGRVATQVDEARVAVAELIEAAKRANGDHTAPHDCYATGPMTGDPIRDLVSCPGCELVAALARCTGDTK